MKVNIMKFMTLVLTACTALVISVGIANAVEKGHGRTSTFVYVTADDLQIVDTGTTFDIIPDMTVDFWASRRGPVIIHFCAAVNIIGGSMRVGAEVDGVEVLSPADLQFTTTATRLPRCFTYVAPDVSRGKHNVSILWRNIGDGQNVVQERTLIVEPGRLF